MNVSMLKNRVAVRFASAFAASVLVACAPESPKLAPYHPNVPEKVAEKGAKIRYNPKVDILFVVDDSGSMSTHQENLARNIQRFTNGIIRARALDYRIGVINSSFEDYYSTKPGGYLRGNPKVIERATENGAMYLARNLIVGTDGSATEKFFAPVQAALTAPIVNNENKGFYRDDAYLVLIFITDTDDQSTKLNAKQFYDFLVKLKSGDQDRVVSYAAYIPSTDRDCDRSGENDPKNLEEFFTLANSKTFSLCDNFGSKLAELARNLVDRVTTIKLPRAPVEKTILVTYGSQIIPQDVRKGWSYNSHRNTLEFGNEIEWSEQPKGTGVDINYDVASYDDL